MAILGLLAALLLPALNHARVKARDSRRIADIEAIRKALELQMTNDGYYFKSGGFTNTKCLHNCGDDCSELLNYISKFPEDPLGTSKQCYLVASDGRNFRVAAKLEKDNEKSRNDGGIYSQFFKAYSDFAEIPLTNYMAVWPNKAYLEPYYGTHLKAWWTFEEGSGSTTADFSGNNNTGTLNGPTWQTSNCISDYCLSFDGNDYVSGSNLNLANSPFTISAWIKANTANTRQYFSLGSENANRKAIHLRLKSATLFNFGLLNDDLDNVPLTNVTTRWTHLVVSLDSNHIQRVYQNGSLVRSRTAGGYFTGNTSWNIGRWVLSISQSEYFDGLIDEIRIYNKALSDSEVCQRCKEFKDAAFCNNCSE